MTKNYTHLEDLPSQTTATVLGIPTSGLGVEDGLGEGEPLRLIGFRMRKIVFGGRHDGETPESLIIVSFGSGLVEGHVIVVVADLEEQCLLGEGNVFVVACVGPVIDEGSHHGTGIPPCESD